jgi:hypothetical protein
MLESYKEISILYDNAVLRYLFIKVYPSYY